MRGTAIMKHQDRRLWKVAEIAVAGALTWGILELTSSYVGRGAAWILGLAILVVIAIILLRRRQKP